MPHSPLTRQRPVHSLALRRTHTSTLCLSSNQRRWQIGSMQHVLPSLRPSAAGDLLRFTPTGRGAASVSLVQAAPAAALAGVQQAASGREGGAGVPPPRAARAPAVRAVAAAKPRSTDWHGLEPTDSRRYTKTLPTTAFTGSQLSMPGVCVCTLAADPAEHAVADALRMPPACSRLHLQRATPLLRSGGPLRRVAASWRSQPSALPMAGALC